MVIKPTYDDANLILRLYEERREDKMRAARDWFAQSFKYHTMEEFNRGCPPGSSMNAYARMVLSYWEMVSSFVTGGVLNQELFFQSGMELLFVWVRVRDLVPLMREANKNPNLSEPGDGGQRVHRLAGRTVAGSLRCFRRPDRVVSRYGSRLGARFLKNSDATSRLTPGLSSLRRKLFNNGGR